MKMEQSTINVRTRARTETLDITDQVDEFLGKAGVQSGMLLVFCPHATCGIYLNENESGLRQDVLQLLRRLTEGTSYQHDQIDDNAAAHLASVLVGHSACLPLSGGRRLTGTWQQVFLLELDGPRTRTVHFFALGE